MMVVCQDWREAGADEVASLIAAEAGLWKSELSWDVSRSWRVIDPARAAGVLPGFIARGDDGRVLGWTWFLEQEGSLQIAALVAQHAPVVRALLACILDSPEAQRSTAHVLSVRGVPAGLVSALGAREFSTARYLYLSAPLDRRTAGLPGRPWREAGLAGRPWREAGLAGRPWRSIDVPAVATLFERAYGETGRVRAFAPHGSSSEWCDYVLSLLAADGCGEFLPGASAIVDGPDGTAQAAIVTTAIAADVAHLAQIVVDPDQQGAGCGRALLEGAMAAAAGEGFRQMTLLVAEDSDAARALYARAGFRQQSTFLIASSQPRRLNDVALVGGGDSTRP